MKRPRAGLRDVQGETSGHKCAKPVGAWGGGALSEIGKPRRRVEDRRLVTGRGRYADDFTPEGAAYAALVRSPHAHARIGGIDTARAAALPGVLAVLTGADTAADGIGPIPHNPDWQGGPDVELRLPDGFEVALTPNPPLPVDIVRYCGEAVALVVAETAALAADAAELVAVDYEPLPAVTDARAAMAGGAPQLWPRLPGKPGAHLRGRRPRGGGCGLCGRGPCRNARKPYPPRQRRSDGAARRGRRIRRRNRPLHPCGQPPDAAPCKRASGLRSRSACRGRTAGRSSATWAAISAPGTPSRRSSRSCPGRRGASGGR